MNQLTFEQIYRKEILKQLKGMKYWLYLFGL